MRELQNIFAQIGFHCFQLVLLQTLVEVNLLAGHRFRFHDQPCAVLLGQSQHEIGDLLSVAAKNHLAPVRHHVRLQLLEVVIEILDGVFLDEVRLGAKILILRQYARADGRGAVIHQPPAGSVDGQLKPGIVESLFDGF